MHDRTAEIVAELSHATDIAGRDDIGIGRADMRSFSLTQSLRHLRLQKIVGARRAAAEMPLRYVDHFETGGAQERALLFDDLLDVLHGALIMIGDAVGRHARRGFS